MARRAGSVEEGSMSDPTYAFSARPTRNPFRYMLALWRGMRDLTNTEEIAIVEIGFARSRLGRRFARWNVVVDALAADPRTAGALAERREFGPLDLDALAELPEGSLGNAFARHCRARNLNPNLVDIPGDSAVDWLLRHLYGTHDLWHVATGWGNDEPGEIGLGGFYIAQVPAPFFPFILGLILFNTALFAPGRLHERMDALTAGYRLGRRAEPLFGLDWESLWPLPLEEVRRRLGLEDAQIVGEGVLRAA
jgi:ubiquinone biosynthesis protein Coq4